KGKAEKTKGDKGKEEKAKGDEKTKADKGKEEVWTFEFGNAGKSGKDKGVYAQVSGQDIVFLAPEKAVTTLREVELHDRTVFKLEPTKVREVDFRGWKEVSKVIVKLNLKRKNAEEEWKASGVEDFKLTQDKATDFVKSNADLKALKFVSFKGAPTSE